MNVGYIECVELCLYVRIIALPLFEGYPVVVKGSGQVNEIPISKLRKCPPPHNHLNERNCRHFLQMEILKDQTPRKS